MKPAKPGTHRIIARQFVRQVIEDHVHGPVQLLHKKDVLELLPAPGEFNKTSSIPAIIS